MLRIVKNLAWWPLFNDDTVMQKYDVIGDFAGETLDNLDPVATAAAFAPGLEEAGVVMVVDRVFKLVRGAALDSELDAALAAVSVPDAVVEAELHLLLNVAGEIVGRDPACVDVEGGLASALVFVDETKLGRVPGGSVLRPDETTLTRALNTLELAAKSEVD